MRRHLARRSFPLLMVLPLVFGTAASALAADALSDAKLEPRDFPAGFQPVSETQLSDAGISARTVGQAFADFLTDAKLLSYSVHATANGSEVVESFLVGPLTPAERAELDREIEDRQLMLDTFGDVIWSPFADTGEPRVLDASDVGDSSFGFAVEATTSSDMAKFQSLFGSATGSRLLFELLLARRGEYMMFVALGHIGQGEALADVVDLARILDTRVGRGQGIGGYRPSGKLVPEITTRIPTPLDVSTDPKVVFANLLIAAIATVLFTVALRVLNVTLAGHEGQLQQAIPPARWLARAQQRADMLVSARLGRRADAVRILEILLFYGIVFSLLEPGWNPFTITGLALLVYMAIAFGAVGIVDDLVEFRTARRWGLPAQLSVRPALAFLAVSSTVATRLFGIVPGIMIGTPDAFPLEKESLGEEHQRRLLKIGATALLVTGGGAWVLSIGTDLAQRATLPGWLATAISGLEALLLVVFAVTVQNVFMQMLALPNTIGAAIERRSKLLWFGALAATTFVFLHTLLNPMGNVAQALGETNVLFFLGTVVVFVAASFGIAFAFRRAERLGTLAAPRPPSGLVESVVAAQPFSVAAPVKVGTVGSVSRLPAPPLGGTGSTISLPPPPPARAPVVSAAPPSGSPGKRIALLLAAFVALAAVAIVAVLLSRGSEKGKPVAAASAFAPSERPSSGGGAAPESQGAVKDVAIVDKGFTQFKPEFTKGAVSYAVVFRNPNPDHVVTPDVTVTFFDGSSKKVAENTDTLILMPGETGAIAETLTDVVGAERMEVEIGDAYAYTEDEWTAEKRPLGAFTAKNPRIDTGQYGAEQVISATVESTYEDGLKEALGVTVFRDAKGKIVGGSFGFLDRIPAGVRTDIEIPSFWTVPGVRSAEVYVSLSWLSF